MSCLVQSLRWQRRPFTILRYLPLYWPSWLHWLTVLSEFAHPDVIIGLSILAYRYEGLRYTDFDEVIKMLSETHQKEVRLQGMFVSRIRLMINVQVGPHYKRASSVRFRDWVFLAGGQMQVRLDLKPVVSKKQTDFRHRAK